jgi:hypothetical protein
MHSVTYSGLLSKLLRRFSRLAASTLILVAGTLLLAAPASAGISHVFSGSIGASGSVPANPYPLSGPTDVAVDQTSHDVYVADQGNRRIEKFDPSGNFLLMFGKEVNKTKTEEGKSEAERDVCTAASSDTCQPGTSGTAPGQFTTPTYLAIDNSNGPSAGDVYVADPGDGLVQKFDSSGHLVTIWGPGGTKDGTDATYYPFAFGEMQDIEVDSEGDLYVDTYVGYITFVYSQDGTYQSPGGPGISSHVAVDPLDGDHYVNNGSSIEHQTCVNGSCNTVDTFGGAQLASPQGVAVDGSTHTVYVADSAGNDVVAFRDARPMVTTGETTNVTESTVTLTGHIDPAGRGNITECHFEYGFDKTYGADVPCTPDPASSNFTEPTEVTATISGFSPGTTDHYRLVATNSIGATSDGADQLLITTQTPSVVGLSSANLTATSADLSAQVNPNGLDTTYRFEYGSTTSYGRLAPVPDGEISASHSDQSIGVHLENLTPHVVYHYRLVAINADGTTATGDQTFNFYPPPCPNENVRQQTRANYLPDCRAYELVSPGDAGGTQLFPTGPNTGYATNPSRFAYSGLFSTIPNSGGSPIDNLGDLYVATRTDTGWVSRYVGLPSDQAAVDGGPVMGPPGSAPGTLGGFSDLPAGANGGPIGLNGILTDPGMDTFLTWDDGDQFFGGPNHTPIASNAPYVLGSDGSLRERWPTNLAIVPNGSYSYPNGYHVYANGKYPGVDNPESVAPGGSHSLDCPNVEDTGYFSGLTYNNCPGDVTASSDLSHFVFASVWNAFAPGGQLTPPGSVYDNDTAASTVTVASKTPAGDDIPSEPTDQAGDPLQIPAVSSDGSHILMASAGTGPCGTASCPAPPCGESFGAAIRCPLQPSHLYMRVGGAVTYDVSQSHDVNYVGSTADGSKVYFTSEEQLTPEDRDTSLDLYMWSEAGEKEGHPLTLISKGNNGAGNSDSCNATFTKGCGVVLYSNRSYCQAQLAGQGAEGGNCLSDNFIAAQSGDIYFFSPEQLDGSRGIPNQENLYDYRNGNVQYVATFTEGPFCVESCGYSYRTETPIVRMQVSPDDSHMAFVTANKVTSYDNAGHLEMYTYDPSAEKIVCVSCIPSGAPPTSNVLASQDGLFMTNDGRTFFSTEDGLVHTDTNRAEDVYEYVDGRPQLITPGTGDITQARGEFGYSPGLIGVSADGTDVYFSTSETLVSQDHNGLFLKFYDARSGGGFPAPAPPPPCTAADECHGADSSPPNLPQITSTGPANSSGNVVPHGAVRHRPKHPRRHRRRTARRASREAAR